MEKLKEVCDFEANTDPRSATREKLLRVGEGLMSSRPYTKGNATPKAC